MYVTLTGETQVTPGTQIDISAVDASGSGINTVQYAVDAGAWVVCTGPLSIRQDGSHTLNFQAWDNVGNKTSSTQVLILTSRYDWDLGSYVLTEGQSESGSVKLVPAALSGTHISHILDLGETPLEDGVFTSTYTAPAGTSLSFEYSCAKVPTSSDWKYKRQITLNNSGQADLSDYQVGITLTPLDFDYLKANYDGSDIRFVDSDEITPLQYFIDSWNPSGQSKV